MNSPKTTPGFGCALVGIPFLPLKPRPNGNATELSTDPATFESEPGRCAAFGVVA